VIGLRRALRGHAASILKSNVSFNESPARIMRYFFARDNGFCCPPSRTVSPATAHWDGRHTCRADSNEESWATKGSDLVISLGWLGERDKRLELCSDRTQRSSQAAGVNFAPTESVRRQLHLYRDHAKREEDL
jgi:hypothetical protein